MRYRKILFAALLALFFMQGQVQAELSRYSTEQDVDFNSLFRDVNETPVSSIARDEFLGAIHNRIGCFGRNFDYINRITLCMSKYREEIVHTARKNISARPEVGLFIKNVAYCPIMYNLCQGKLDPRDPASAELCVNFEHKCIDHMLDKFWRGMPVYSNMQLRIEK